MISDAFPAVFRRFRCNSGQRLCSRQFKQRLPVLPDVARFHVFAHRLAVSGISPITRGNVRVRLKSSDACPFSPNVARFHVFAHRLAVSGVSPLTRGNLLVRVKLSEACSFSLDVARFHVFAHRLAVSGVSPLTRGNLRVCVKSSDACHVFALRLAIFRRFCCITRQRTCPHQVKRCLPVFAHVALFHVFDHGLAVFWLFCCNTGQRTTPR
jgi:hypothetical protein